jgi:hypothetical protein
MNMADKERPSLGDFVRPGSTPAKPAAKKDEPPKPATPTTEEAEEALLAKVDKQEETDADREVKTRLSIYEDISQSLVPVKDYAKFLKDHDISEDKAEEIVDNILMRGFHEETYPLTKKSAVVLRTRAHRDTLRLHQALQIRQPVYQDVANEIIIRYNLAASLSAITGPAEKHFEFPDDETIDEEVVKLFDVRMRYIERMPGALFAKLSMKLSQFDRIVMAVMREGVTENF